MSGLYTSIGIVVFIIASAILTFTVIFLAWLISYRRREPEKEIPYESGMDPIRYAKETYFPVNYYAFAVLFLLFDVEVAFLIPWAMVFTDYGWGGFIAASFFLLILVYGLWFGFKTGSLRWD